MSKRRFRSWIAINTRMRQKDSINTHEEGGRLKKLHKEVSVKGESENRVCPLILSSLDPRSASL